MTRSGNHGKQRAEMMPAVELISSSTGEPDGEEVGPRVHHYFEPGVGFAIACEGPIPDGGAAGYVDVCHEDATKEAKNKATCKTNYKCPVCDANAWAKPGAKLLCGACDGAMMGPEAEGGA